MKTKLLVAGLSALLAVGAQAATVNVSYDAGTTNTTTALTGYSTYGDMMVGMVVTAWFGATSETVVWAATGAGAGAAVGTGWSLSESGDTFGSSWFLTNSSGAALTRLLIDAGPGDSVFDTTAVAGDTAGSASGWSFQLVNISAADANDTINAEYRDAVALGMASPVGDLYRYLDISIRDGLSSGSVMEYVTDTDNLEFAGDLTPVPDTASTLGCLGLGLLAMFGAARRRIA